MHGTWPESQPLSTAPLLAKDCGYGNHNSHSNSVPCELVKLQLVDTLIGLFTGLRVKLENPWPFYGCKFASNNRSLGYSQHHQHFFITMWSVSKCHLRRFSDRPFCAEINIQFPSELIVPIFACANLIAAKSASAMNR